MLLEIQTLLPIQMDIDANTNGNTDEYTNINTIPSVHTFVYPFVVLFSFSFFFFTALCLTGLKKWAFVVVLTKEIVSFASQFATSSTSRRTRDWNPTWERLHWIYLKKFGGGPVLSSFWAFLVDNMMCMNWSIKGRQPRRDANPWKFSNCPGLKAGHLYM